MGGSRTLLVVGLLALPYVGSVRGEMRVPGSDLQGVTLQIGQLLAEDSVPGAPTSNERTQLTALYDLNNLRPLWVDEAGRLTPVAQEAVALLADAAAHGLNPAHYRIAPPRSEPAAWDIATSLAMVRYLGDIAFGRVDPDSVGHHLRRRVDRSWIPATLRNAAAGGRLADAVATAAPPLGRYEELRRALASYRALATTQPWPALPATSSSTRAGDPLPWAAALRARLTAFGDLDPTRATSLPDVLDPALAAAVQRFQRRHGLLDDAIVGPATLAALRVPVATRVRQIELALERLRWMPRDLTGRAILINIPMYRLDAFDDIQSERLALSMKVVVGMAGRYATPVFASQVEQVMFRPYWNVPRSILVRELLPKAMADPRYLSAHDYELVRGESDGGEIVAVSPASLQALAQGTMRLRQRPGPGNALGLIKFILPNPYDVFLHDTSSPSAFSRDRRALSHGCVRLQHPRDLAAWVLEAPVWSPERITEATAGPDVQVVPVSRPVPVLLTYSTAAVDADGTVRFAPDVYGLDRRLERAWR